MNTHKHLIFLVFHVNFYTISIKNVALIAFFFNSESRRALLKLWSKAEKLYQFF